MPAVAAASTRKNGGRGVDGGDVMLIINHVDGRFRELRDEIKADLKEGREAHSREHAAEIEPLKVRVQCLEDDLTARQEARERRDARVEPLVRGAVWVTNHWPVSLAALAAFGWLLVRIGVLHS
jgi:hypothetical protein